MWKAFHDRVESQRGRGGNLAPIQGFAAKAAEHAARIAGVLTIVEDLHADEIGSDAMHNAITLADWHVADACRLQQAGRTDPRLLRAATLLEWLQEQPGSKAEFRKILQFGPSATRTKAAADEALKILTEHGWTGEPHGRTNS